MHMERFATILTSEQAGILYDLVEANREALVSKWGFGVFDGLLQSLTNIERGGGAYVRDRALGYGSELVEAAIIPPSTYIAWLGVRTSMPAPCWDVTALVPQLCIENRGQKLVWEPVSVCRARSPLVIAPLAPAVLPADSPPTTIPVVPAFAVASSPS